ncbi:MAG: Ig-like domain-containing protein [Pirellulaceae bacterium]
MTSYTRCFRRQKNSPGRRRWKRPNGRFALRCESLEPRLMLDGTGPRVLDVTPQEIRNDVFDHIDVVFSEAMDASTFTADDIAISGPTGTIDPMNIEQLGAETFRVTFAPLAVRGSYEATNRSGH